MFAMQCTSELRNGNKKVRVTQNQTPCIQGWNKHIDKPVHCCSCCSDVSFLQATWHPIYDLIVAGRYPDDRICVGDVRSVDIFDANTGDLLCKMLDPDAKGIISVSRLLLRKWFQFLS